MHVCLGESKGVYCEACPVVRVMRQQERALLQQLKTMGEWWWVVVPHSPHSPHTPLAFVTAAVGLSPSNQPPDSIVPVLRSLSDPHLQFC